MENQKKMLNFILVFFFFVNGTFTAIASSERSQKISNKRNNSNYVYLPFISIPKSIIISRFGENCTRMGDLYGVGGWIENLTPNTIYSVTLTLTLYNHITQVHDTFEITPALDATFPNNTNPFRWFTSYLPQPNYGQYGQCEGNSEIEVKTWSFFNSFEYRPVNVISVETEIQTQQYITTGEIRNDQEGVIHGVKVLLHPRCSHYNFATVDDMILSPGEITRFSGITGRPYDFWVPVPPECDTVDVIGQGYLIH